MNRNEAFERIANSKGKWFSVKFVKKNGELRKMTCRIGVKKHLAGGEQKYNPKDYGLFTVFDSQKQDYRNINLNTLQELKIGGETFEVSE